jgi:hypothetical protein
MVKKSTCTGAVNQIQFATGMIIIELFEIAMVICTAWIIASGLLRSFRENRWLS